jgi:hypothetical protein
MPPLKNYFNTPWQNPFLKSATSTRQLPNNGGTYTVTGGITPVPLGANGKPDYSANPYQPTLTPDQIAQGYSADRRDGKILDRPLFTGGGNNNVSGAGGGYTPSPVSVERAKSPEEIAVALKQTMLAGDISNYSYWAMNNPDASTMETANIARRLRDTQGDIGSGATDPYKVASQSKWKFNAQELAAIEKAGAGVYDPAITSAITKLELKQKEETENSARAWEKEKLALQHGYTMEEKGLTAGGSGLAGEYVKGANPAVDAWAQRIFDGTAKITDIPASQKGMRDAVTMALVSSGNDLSGKPTVTELGKSAALGAKELMRKFTEREGTSAVGASRFWTSPLAFPGTDKKDFKIDFQNLKDMLSLEGVKYLKGQGAVSDAERALLANAITKLNLSQSEEDFKTTLQGIIDRLTGATTSGESSKPQTMILNGVTLQLQADGTYE